MNCSKDRALAYYAAINAKDLDGVCALFTPDAVFSLYDGRQVAGLEAIRAMYVNVFAAGGPQPQPTVIVPAQTHVAAEVTVTLANGQALNMASFFALADDGRFRSVAVYRRG